MSDQVASITSKPILIFLFSIVTLITLHKPLEVLLSNTVVDYALGFIESAWYNDIIFISISILIIISVIFRYNRYIPSNNMVLVLIMATIYYCFYRFDGNIWEFKGFYFYSRIKYADILILSSISNLFLFYQEKNTTKRNTKDSFFSDEPIKESKNDELGYDSYARLLASKIQSSYFNKSFAIGINGKWGLGKTSFINLLKKKINDDSIIEIDFNPWNSNSPKAIIQDFFETIQEKIRPYHSAISHLLISYSNKLISLNDNTITQTIQTSVSALSGFESLNSLSKDIDNALKKINKKIIVYIDDIDRLDRDEIIEVMRLIRNTANFHNTFFIVAYDRDYIVNILKHDYQYKQEKYLEKIFQIEVTLPYFNKEIFNQKLAEKIKEKFSEDYHKIIDSDIIGTPSIIPSSLNNWLESMRDVTRLANALVLNLSKLEGEVVFNDFLRLELLRLKYPSVYELLFKKTEDFLDAYSNSFKEHQYQLKYLDKNNKELQEGTSFEKCNTTLELHLNQNYSELSIPKYQIPEIIDFISGIFDGNNSYSLHNRSHLSVIYPSKFNRYFAYNLLEGTLSEIEFSKARVLSQEEFNKKIKKWVNENLESELKNRFAEIKSFDNREDFEKIITAIFYLANQKSTNSEDNIKDIIRYDAKDLNNKLSNYENKLADGYYSDLNGKEGLENFLVSLFESAKSPFHFEADLIRYINSVYEESFPLKKEKLSEIVVNYFKTYCSTIEKIDSNVWNLFHCCKQTNWIHGVDNSLQKKEVFPEDAKKILIDFIHTRDLNGFLRDIIAPMAFKKGKFAISLIIIELFDNWPSFKEFLETQNEEKWSYLKEFKDFFSSFEEEKFLKYIDFDFKIIPIEEKK